MKGGVCKSTNAANIGAELARMGQMVLLVDLDPGAGLTQFVGADQEGIPEPESWLGDLLVAGAYGQAEKAMVLSPQPGCGERLWIMPSQGSALGAAEKLLSGANDGAFRLSKMLNQLHAHWDWIIVDTPPNLETFSFCSMVAATDVFICCTPEAATYTKAPEVPEQFEVAVQISRAIGNEREPKLRGVIRSKGEGRKAIANRISLQWLEEEGLTVCPVIPTKHAFIGNTAANGVPAVLAFPDSDTAEDYRRLIRWIIELEDHDAAATAERIAA